MMFDRQSPQRTHTTRDTSTHPAPGRTTLVQQAYDQHATAAPARAAPSRAEPMPAASAPAASAHSASASASPPLFAGDARWEDISPEEGEQMLRGFRPAPDDAAFEEAEVDAASADGAPEVDGEAGPDPDANPREVSDEDGAPVAAAASTGGASQKPGQSPGRQTGAPRSPYATSHQKEMRNYRFRPGTHVTNTFSTAGGKPDDKRGDFGAPNTYEPVTNDQLAHTVSVDIGTVVGGSKRKQYRSGWVLVFHQTTLRGPDGAIKTASGDHTGWIRVGQLPKAAIPSLAKLQTRVRRTLKRGTGSGHAARLTRKLYTIDPINHEMLYLSKLTNHFQFLIKGASQDRAANDNAPDGNAPAGKDAAEKPRPGSQGTSLGNYTLNPERYGNAIVGAWNPPGSTTGSGSRGSGGIRAFFSTSTRFQLADTPPLIIPDVTGTATSTWVYVGAEINGQQIYCWLLRSWDAPVPNGRGRNF